MHKHLVITDTRSLQLGMFIADLDCPWLDTPFLLQGFLLEDEEDRKTLQRLCRTVVVDTLRSTIEVSGPQADLRPPNTELKEYVEEVPLELEMPRAHKTYARSEVVLNELVHDMRTGSHLHLEKVDDVVDDMVESVIANPDALMWVARLQQEHGTTYTHGLRVSVYLLALGRQLGFPARELHHLGMTGLLLDLGKTRLPVELLGRRGKLTAAEFETVKRHVELGIEMLSGSAGVHSNVLEGIAQHHERLNGRGYPRGLKAEEIGIFGRMAGIADTFAALTSPRTYDQTVSPSDALSTLYDAAGEYFHRPLIERFVQAIGAFPVGSLVELSAGEVAIVVRHNRVRRLQPTVLVVTDRDKRKLEQPQLLDLLYQQEAPRAEPTRIRRGLPVDAYSIDANAYFVAATRAQSARAKAPD